MNQKEIDQLYAAAAPKMADGMRAGQALMGALFEINPNLYKRITGSPYDPFYLDLKIPDFLSCISSEENS